jgi:hypothetical protein
MGAVKIPTTYLQMFARPEVCPGHPLSSSPSVSFRFMIRRCSPRSRSWRSCGSLAPPFTVSSRLLQREERLLRSERSARLL